MKTSSENLLHEWMSKMKTGNFREAWNISDTILQTSYTGHQKNIPRHYQNIWNGTSLHNKSVLIRCYHGLGDTIQFIRYVFLLRNIAKEIKVFIQPQLIQLLKTIPSIDAFIPLTDNDTTEKYDVDIEIMELPYIFRTTIETIPVLSPYLFVEPFPLIKKHDQLYVGLIWKCGNWENSRSIPFEYLKLLSDLNNVQFYILQDAPYDAGWDESFGIYPGSFDLYNYARFIKSMDVIVSVDSMPVHLAGAMNVPVYNLLQHHCDWRWMENRDDSPWYPSMKLFRQPLCSDWNAVIKNVYENLQQKQQEKLSGSQSLYN